MVSLRHSSNIRVAFNEKFKEWSKGYMPHARGWGGRGGGVEARDVVGVRHSSNISTALMRSFKVGVKVVCQVQESVKKSQLLCLWLKWAFD